MAINLAREGFRAAPTREEKVFEAAKLFGKGRNPNNKFDQAVLHEAFTTSDFPELLATAFTDQAVAAQQQAQPEFTELLARMPSMDFEPRRLVDMWSGDEFEEVTEGAEYPMGTINTMQDMYHRARKNGKKYGLTWELRLRNEFSQLANFPTYLGNGSVRGKNTAVAKTLVTDQGTWNTEIFEDVKATPLTPDNLQLAIEEIGARENHRGDLVDTSSLVLVFGPALRGQVNNILLSDEIEMTETVGNKKTVRRIQNPFANLVTTLESRSIGKRLNSAAAWALIPSGSSDLPALIETYIPGQETVDIRVKRDQGASVGGGDLPYDAGSFNDDTIWFRGRDVWGIDPGFKDGAWASTGA